MYMRAWTAVFLIPFVCNAQELVRPGSKAGQPMVDVAEAAPRIVVELRYATDRNLTKTAIYPQGARCYVRQSVAERLNRAQDWLDRKAPKGTRLKIWDGWRPAWAQERLWKVFPDREYVANPRAGSLHTWGVAVDVTLVDAAGNDLRMPTDFDVLTLAARTRYNGADKEVRRNLELLQRAMSVAGFQVLHDEWWHFVARDWQAFAPTNASLTSGSTPEPSPRGKVAPLPNKKLSISSR
jgi:D-alanyl-D-alanine dipeptidase